MHVHLSSGRSVPRSGTSWSVKSWAPLLAALALTCFATGEVVAQAQTNYEPYTFTTLAGALPGSADGGAADARFNQPGGTAVDSNGNVYVADTFNHTIRKITPAGVVSTLAGLAGSAGSEDGTGSNARFNQPAGIAIRSDGNLYVADRGNHTIRSITPAGEVATFAGAAGISGSENGDNVPDWRFNSPSDVAFSSSGDLYIADTGNHTIRKITTAPGLVASDFAGQTGVPGSANGTGTVAQFNAPSGVAVDGAGNVFVGDTGNHTIRRITPTRSTSTLAGLPGSAGSADGTTTAARFNRPVGVAVDSAGFVYVADSGNNTIRKVNSVGTPTVVTTLAGSAASAGSADGTGSAARFNMPLGVALDSSPNANVYVADTGNNTIRMITAAGAVTTLAGRAATGGDDGNGIDARFNQPAGMTINAAGDVILADRGNHTVRKVTPAGDVTTLAGLAGSSGSSDSDQGPARFNTPSDVAIDAGGNIYVADTGNHTIRKITPAGVVTTFAGFAGSSGTADGTGSTARFNSPSGLAVDSSGNVYVADTGNHAIRRIVPAGPTGGVGTVSLFAGLPAVQGSANGGLAAARFNSPRGLAIDGTGSIYVADTGNHTIRKITPNSVSTFAGAAGIPGAADAASGANARFRSPHNVAVDGANNLYVADAGNHTIRKLTPAGLVTTLAGVPLNSGNADGDGSAARFSGPQGVAVDGGGNLYVGDTSNNTVRSATKLLPPAITSPLGVRVTLGQPFYYLLKATSDPSTYGAGDLPDGLFYDSFLDAILGTPENTGTFGCTLTASNEAGTTTETLNMVVQDVPASGLTITSSYSSSGRTGMPFEFQVITSGGSAATRITASTLPPGLSIDEMTGLISGTPTADGSFSVGLTATDGSNSTNETLQLTFISDPTVPVIVTPSSAVIAEGQPFNYTISAPASSDPEDDTEFTMIGDLPAGLGFDSSTGTIGGTYTPQAARTASKGKPLTGGGITQVQLFATNSQGTSTIPLVFFLAPKGVVNISTRLAIGTGDNVLIAGFIVTGNAPKKLIIRAIAPSLGIAGALQDPRLELREGANLLGANDDWRSTQEQDIIATTIPPADNRESALVAILQPGAYTAVIAGKDGSTGIGLAEVYDLGTASLESTSDSKLANISTRGFVQTGDDIMIGGFIVSGAPTKVIVRAVGPSLANRGVAGALDDTTLDFVDGNGALIVANDDWRTGGQEQQIIDTTVPPDDNRESAVVATINPGGYTALIRGKDGRTGVALVEVYVLN